MNVSDVSTKNSRAWATTKLLGLSLTVVLSGVTLLSGCAVQETSLKGSNQLIAQPVVDARLSEDDFGFPSQPPSLITGKKVYQANCAACHTASSWQQPKVQQDLRYSTPIDLYLMLSRGEAPTVTHPSPERPQVLPAFHGDAKTGQKLLFRDKLSRDERWAAIFYARYLAGNGDMQYQSLDGKPLDVAAVFGGNCAVCHGSRGFADGFLHTGRPSKHGVEGGKVHIGLFEPQPANFHDYHRFYNRTDAQLFKYISEGIYPSAMPPWAGRVDKDKNFVFDDKLRWMLVRYVRQFSYDLKNLPDDAPVPPGSIPGSVNTTAVSAVAPAQPATQPKAAATKNVKAEEKHS